MSSGRTADEAPTRPVVVDGRSLELLSDDELGELARQIVKKLTTKPEG